MRNPNVSRNLLMGISLSAAALVGNEVLGACGVADYSLPLTVDPTVGQVHMVGGRTYIEGCFTEDALAPGTKEGDDALGGTLTINRLDATAIDVVYAHGTFSPLSGEVTSLQDKRHEPVDSGSPIGRQVTSEGVRCHMDFVPGFTLPDEFNNGLVQIGATNTDHLVTAVEGPLNASTRAVEGQLVTDVAAGQPPVPVRYIVAPA
jgi:hypothetical protein